MDSIDLIMEAQDLSNALVGLDLLALGHFGSTDVNLEDINALIGIIASIKIMAESHRDHVVNQLEGIADGK